MFDYFYYFLLAVFPIIFLTGCCGKECNRFCKKTCIESKAVILEANDELKEKTKNTADKVHEVIEEVIVK